MMRLKTPAEFEAEHPRNHKADCACERCHRPVTQADYYALLKMVRRIAAHQLRMGQAIQVLSGQATCAGMNKEEVSGKLAEQNHYLERAIAEGY